MFSAICLWRSARLGGTPAPQRTSGTGAIALRDYLCIKQASASLRLTKAKYVLHPDAGHIVGCINDPTLPGVYLLGQGDIIFQPQHAAIRLHACSLCGLASPWKQKTRQIHFIDFQAYEPNASFSNSGGLGHPFSSQYLRRKGSMAQSRALLISHSGSAALRYHFANYCASISKTKKHDEQACDRYRHRTRPQRFSGTPSARSIQHARGPRQRRWSGDYASCLDAIGNTWCPATPLRSDINVSGRPPAMLALCLLRGDHRCDHDRDAATFAAIVPISGGDSAKH
jgi:hypothetical protein